MKITEQMICREAVRIAYRYGLEKSMNEEVFQCNYDVIHDINYLNYKTNKVAYLYDDLGMSIDDFAEKIIVPFILQLLPDELKFIQMDCS